MTLIINSLDELKRVADDPKNIRLTRNKSRTFTQEVINAVVLFRKDSGATATSIAHILGLTYQTIYTWQFRELNQLTPLKENTMIQESNITSLPQALGVLTHIRSSTVGNAQAHFPVLVKKKIVELYYKYPSTGRTQKEFCGYLNLSPSVINRWVSQYEEGLYTLEGAYNVSKKHALKPNKDMLSILKGELLESQKKTKELEEKVNVLEECKRLGIQVTA